MAGYFGSVHQAYVRTILGLVGRFIDQCNGVKGKGGNYRRRFFRYCCAYCGKWLGAKKNGHNEHIYPVNETYWGSGCCGNIALACKECDNQFKKGNVDFRDHIRTVAPSAEVAEARIAKMYQWFDECKFEYDSVLVKSIAQPLLAAFKKTLERYHPKLVLDVSDVFRAIKQRRAEKRAMKEAGIPVVEEKRPPREKMWDSMIGEKGWETDEG